MHVHKKWLNGHFKADLTRNLAKSAGEPGISSGWTGHETRLYKATLRFVVFPTLSAHLVIRRVQLCSRCVCDGRILGADGDAGATCSFLGMHF